MQAAQRQDEVELEIAAFQGPHIKRARIVLVAIGILFAVTGYLNYDDAKQLRAMVAGIDNEALKDEVNMIYGAVIFSMVAGVANIFLAWWAGTRTMIAFYAAGVIFIVHTMLHLAFRGGGIITNIFWWLTAVCLVLGFEAARKAEKMRKGARVATATAPMRD